MPNDERSVDPKKKIRLLVVITVGAVIFTIISGVTVFFDWHIIEDSRWVDAFFCAGIPDCDPSVLSGFRPDREDTGFSHTGPFIHVLLGLMVLFWWVSWKVESWKLVLLASCSNIVLSLAAILWSVSTLMWSHMFARVTELFAMHLFFFSLALCTMLALAALLLRILGRRARRKEHLAE